ncbi:MAG TPA: [LysW]-lysine hydrolase [Gemmatimonadales bacterium]|nr:[LysW]-lysine hydrolase [Gemmatimonadales bacterium]
MPELPGDDRAIALLTDLVSTPSRSGQERAASERLVAWMAEHGFDAQVDAVGNAVGVRGTGLREVLLLGHIDTFPGDVPVRRDGDRLYGRGSVDAKGPLCAFAAAAALDPVPVGWRVTVVGAVEEEAATSRGARHVLEARVPGARPGPPAYCVVGEPSRWDRVTLGYRGRLVFDIRLRAPFAHSAGAERLPAERGIALWSAVERYCAEWNAGHDVRDSVFDALSPSLRTFVTSDEGAFGMVRLGVGVRLPLAADPETVHRELTVRLRESAAPGDQVELDIGVLGGEPAYRGGKSNALVRAFLAEIRARGGAPRFVVKTGTSDMNVVGPFWPRTPIVAYGPGDSALDHTPQEHVGLAEYLATIGVLRGVLRRLFAG